MRNAMRPAEIAAWCLLFPWSLGWADGSLIERIETHVPKLTTPRGTRLPLLVWQHSDMPTGLESGDVASIQDVYLSRGLLPLCNDCFSPQAAKRYLPVFRHWRERGVPVCLLPQGWLQNLCVPDTTGTPRCVHAPPATPSQEYPCLASMARLPEESESQAKSVVETLRVLEENQFDLRLLLVDFESGAYLRNELAFEAAVVDQARMAAECPRCAELLGAKNGPIAPKAYAQAANETRARVTRRLLSEPARSVFPNVALGNYFAWPIDRLPPSKGRYPAYGYESSGLNVAMPRMYVHPGWQGANADQLLVNWNVFFTCLSEFSPAAEVRREDELLIPWVHAWIQGQGLERVLSGKTPPQPAVFAEVARHMLLRGAETFAIWSDSAIGDFPAGYPFPEYAAMGQLVYNIVGLQEGYRDLLPYEKFLRRSQPAHFGVPGKLNALSPRNRVWSAMYDDNLALVRTIGFTRGSGSPGPVRIWGKTFMLPFRREGAFWRLSRDGEIRELTPERSAR